MKRRDLGRVIAIGSIGALTARCEKAPETTVQPVTSKKKALMQVGDKYSNTSKEGLEFKARHGVYHIHANPPKTIKGVGWEIEDSLKIKEACEKYGISLDAYPLPLLSGGIDRAEYPNIMLGKSPERDREIEILQQMIEVAGKTGIRLVTYNTTILPVLRTGRTPDPARGNAGYSTWDYEEAVKREPYLKTITGVVSSDMMYERITYLLDRLLPVAEEWKIQLGCHTADPPTHAGFQGITHWNSPDVFEGLKRYAGLYNSPYHGFLLCIGSVAEGLKDPKTEIHPIIKYFGERKKIFHVDFRNIKGGWDKFVEVYPDNGDMDLYEVAKTFRDVGYPYMLCPDHVPYHPDKGSAQQGLAFAFGYIKALIQAANGEVA